MLEFISNKVLALIAILGVLFSIISTISQYHSLRNQVAKACAEQPVGFSQLVSPGHPCRIHLSLSDTRIFILFVVILLLLSSVHILIAQRLWSC